MSKYKQSQRYWDAKVEKDFGKFSTGFSTGQTDDKSLKDEGLSLFSEISTGPTTRDKGERSREVDFPPLRKGKDLAFERWADRHKPTPHRYGRKKRWEPPLRPGWWKAFETSERISFDLVEIDADEVLRRGRFARKQST